MIWRSEIVRNLSKLSLGTVGAQLVPLLLAPVISRLFTADDFGYFAAVLALVNIFSVIINTRYELSVVLPREDKEANELIVGGWLVGFLMVCFTVVFLLLFIDEASNKLDVSLKASDVIIVGLTLSAVALWQPLNYFFIRKKAFSAMVLNKVVKSTSLTLITILLGWLGITFISNGLVLGLLAGWIFIVVFSLYQAGRIGFDFKGIQWSEVKIQLVKYKSYPLVNSLPALINSIGLQLGVYLFAYFYSQEITGHYSFAKQYVYAPMSIVGVSLAQVYFQRISEKYKSQSSILKELKLVFLILLSISILAILVVRLFVSEIFDLVFGPEWSTSALMARYLIFYFGIQFIVSPLSNILYALNRVKLASVFPVVYVTSLTSLFFLPRMEMFDFLEIYIIAESVPYVIYLGLILLAVIQYEQNRAVEK